MIHIFHNVKKLLLSVLVLCGYNGRYSLFTAGFSVSYLYINLERHLASQLQSVASLTFTFAEIERIVGRPLPRSAYNHQAWRANQQNFSGRPQARAWLSGGFDVDHVNLIGTTIRFRRSGSRLLADSDPQHANVPPRATTPLKGAVPVSTGESVIVLISCASQKLQLPAAAKDLYTSALFRLNYAYAAKLEPRAIFILSAKHGLVSPEDVVAPYDMTLNTMPQNERRAWGGKVLQQIAEKTEIYKSRYIFLAGARYREHLAPALPQHETPLEGLTIGRQLQRLRELADG